MLNWDIYADVAGGWRWRASATNGRILAQSSESYVNRGDCVHCAKLFGYQGS